MNTNESQDDLRFTCILREYPKNDSFGHISEKKKKPNAEKMVVVVAHFLSYSRQ